MEPLLVHPDPPPPELARVLDLGGYPWKPVADERQAVTETPDDGWGGAIVVVAGSRWSQRAPLIIGAVVTAAGALHLLSLAGPWLVLIPVGLLLLVLGANREKRARDLARLRGVYSRMR